MSTTKGLNPKDRTVPSAAAEVTAPAFERIGVAAVATLVPSLLLVHALAAVLHTAPGISPGAVVVSLAVVAVSAIHALIQWRIPGAPAWGWVATSVVAAWLVATITGGIAGTLSVAICSLMQGFAQSRIARALPSTIAGLISRYPWRAVGWSLLAVLAVLQTGRLATHEADPSVPWWVTSKNPAWAEHLCIASYVWAADLHNQGVTNIYDDSNYPPPKDSDEAPKPTVENLERHLECGFEYPPSFLLLPWTMLQFTNDFYAIRPVWLAFIGLVFFGVAVSLCLWVGGPRGAAALWLMPALWVAVPTLQTFQFGQFHLMTFALALGGMVALESRRASLGGALLAAAVVTKLYPAVLIPLLAVQRRWRALGMTVIWMAGIGAVGLVLLGAAPNKAFLTYQLPGILNGSVFDYSDMEPAAQDIMAAIMVSLSTLPQRLRIIGAPLLPKELGPWLARALAVVILTLIWRARRGTRSHGNCVMLWLALLNLVVLQGPSAFVDYTTATNLWLLTFVGYDMARSRALATGGWICWLLLGTLLGTFPIPDDPTGVWPHVAIHRVLISASTLLMTMLIVPLNLWCAMRRDGVGRNEGGLRDEFDTTCKG